MISEQPVLLRSYEIKLSERPTIFAGTHCVPCKAAGTDGKVLGECNESFGFGQKICRNCKIIRRKGVVRVICTDLRHKQRQG